MGEETTQLDLGDELDRLEAMRGEGGDDDESLRVDIHDAVLEPEGVEGRRLTAMTLEGPPDLRGRRWEYPLDALHDPAVTARRGDAELTVVELVDAVGGPALDAPYILDRESYVVGVVERESEGEDPLTLRTVEAPEESDHAEGETLELDRTALATATVAGYRDRRRYRLFDPYGRPTELDG